MQLNFANDQTMLTQIALDIEIMLKSFCIHCKKRELNNSLEKTEYMIVNEKMSFKKVQILNIYEQILAKKKG